jgi:hypothetical protein
VLIGSGIEATHVKVEPSGLARNVVDNRAEDAIGINTRYT